MKKILKYTFVLAAASALATGCIKEVLPQNGSISDEAAANSSAGIDGLASAISNYAATANWIDNGNRHNIYGLPSLGVIRDIWCNDMTAVETSYDHYISFAQNVYMQGKYVNLQLIWNLSVKLAALCNDIIRQYPDLDDVPEDVIPYLGAAYAYRSWIWLDMAQEYEFKENNYTEGSKVVGLTIPYVHENMTEEESRHNPRVPKAEMLGHIKEGLEIAIPMLEGVSWSDRNLPDQAVAYGILAKAYLYEEDYGKAKEAAQNALAAGSFSPLTEAQWTDPVTGFNSLGSQNSWMICCRLSNESRPVTSGIINFTSWMASENTFGYGGLGGGTPRLADKRFYSQISDSDFRKKSWKAPRGSSLQIKYVPATSGYAGPDALPEYCCIKFRPGQGNPDDYLTACAVDIPLMRMEEMKFIIAECDARLSGSSAALVEIVKTRNPNYSDLGLSGDALLKEVFFQKRIEFWGEGVMFFDYKRCPDLLQIERGYAGTNHSVGARFNSDGLAPWFNVVISEYEAQRNPAIVNNPDPSDTIGLMNY